MTPSIHNHGSSLRERVPTPDNPYDPVNRRLEFIAWQEGCGAGIRFTTELARAIEESEQ